MNRTRKLYVALAAALFTVSAAYAEVEEITTTATRRAENMQEVPIAVSAFSETDMEQQQIYLVKDIARSVPNMKSFQVTANQAAMQVFMRGTGVQNPGFNASESPVGYYVDDVFRGRLATANLDLTEVERIEVLRGPQGTLYGRNTIAGAVKIVTRTPEDTVYGTASYGVGNYETRKLTASIGGPLIEGKLAGSIAVLSNQREKGWIERGSVGGRPLGEFDNGAVRGKLHWYAGDIFDAVFSVGYFDSDNDGWNGIPYTGNPGVPIEGFYDTLVQDQFIGYGNTDQLDSSLKLSWDFAGLEVKSITGYTDIDDSFGFDLTGGTGPFPISSTSNNKTFSQEFNISGDAFADSIPFHWIAGLYFLNEDGDQIYNSTAVETMETETNSYAVYGEGTWDITQKLGLTLGARVTRDDKKFTDNCSTGAADCTTGPLVPGPPVNLPGGWVVNLEDTWTEFTPRAMLSYNVTDNTMVWASWSKGFQAGGYQTLCLGNEDCAEIVYDPQTVTSTELGVKTDLFDNTLRINASAWYAQYHDIQQVVITNGVFPLVNAGDVDVLGFDLETYWVPSDNFDVYLILGLAGDDFSSLPPAVSFWSDLPGLPQVAARFGVNGNVPAFADWSAVGGLDVDYSDDYLSALAGDPNDLLTIDSFARLNGYVGLQQLEGSWSVILKGTNLTDAEDNVSGIVQSGFALNVRTPQPPREYMLEARYRY